MHTVPALETLEPIKKFIFIVPKNAHRSNKNQFQTSVQHCFSIKFMIKIYICSFGLNQFLGFQVNFYPRMNATWLIISQHLFR